MNEQFMLDGAPGAFASFNGKVYSYFGGTSYYELHKHEDVIKASTEALIKYGVTSSSSRSSYGTTQLLLDVESEAANFFNAEDAVCLSSGFLTDLAALQALVNQNLFDVVFIDEISHYSNNYAAKLSGKPIYRFAHRDYSNLEEKTKAFLLKDQKPLIITDGIFPIFGRIAPIKEYLSIVEKYNGIIWIDDAHGLGVIGKNGRGTIEHFGLASERVFFGGTFSKAFGGFGGIIPGKKVFVDEIRNDQIQNGATPVPSAAAAASLTGMRILKANSEMRTKLWLNANRLKSGLAQIGIKTDNTSVPITAWKMKSVDEMRKIQRELKKKDIIIQLINYVGAGDGGALRIVVFSTHTIEQIDNLVYELKRIL